MKMVLDGVAPVVSADATSKLKKPAVLLPGMARLMPAGLDSSIAFSVRVL
jgi:hypothetical protein